MTTVHSGPVAWADCYKTARWKRLRQMQLRQHRFASFVSSGIVTVANVADHVDPHHGDWTEFITGKLQSLCEPCHKSAKRQIELRCYRYETSGSIVIQPIQIIRLIVQAKMAAARNFGNSLSNL